MVKTLVDNIYYYQDELGSTSHVANASGALLEYYKYDLYGKPTYFSSTSQQINSSTYGVKDLFTGQRWVVQIGLYDDRNRFMSPDLGRFLQPDPIGFKGDASNLYRYVGNDWANRTDPTGTEDETHKKNAVPENKDDSKSERVVVTGSTPNASKVEPKTQYGPPGGPKGSVPGGFVPHNGPDNKQVTSKIYKDKGGGEYQNRGWQVVDTNGNHFKAGNLKNTETPIDSPGVQIKTSTQVPINSQGHMTDKVGMSKDQLARVADGPISFGVKNTVTWDGKAYQLSTAFHDTITVKDHHIQSIESKAYEAQ